MRYSYQEIERFNTILDFHLKKEEKNLPPAQQKPFIVAKRKRIRFLNIINILGAAFFIYWFVSGLTQLSNIIMYVVIAVFFLNLLALNVQRKQLGEVLEYLDEKENSA